MVKHFDPGAVGYSSTNALWLGQAARLAYRDPAMIEASIRTWEFQQFCFFDRDATQAFLLSNSEVIVLAFRGTQMRCLRDWMTDIRFSLVPSCGGQVHRGFSLALDLIWDEVMAQLNRCHSSQKAIFVTGHSLGAGLATLAASRLQNKDHNVHSLYTFGSPRVGDREFERCFTAEMGLRTFRFVNHNDVITQIPPRSLGYRHVGLVLYFDSTGVLRPDIRYWDKFLETVEGGFYDLFDPGIDLIQDHDMEEYAKNLVSNIDPQLNLDLSAIAVSR
mgnify:CR=1 FL=1